MNHTLLIEADKRSGTLARPQDSFTSETAAGLTGHYRLIGTKANLFYSRWFQVEQRKRTSGEQIYL